MVDCSPPVYRIATLSKRRAWVANGQRQQRRFLKQLRTAVPNSVFVLRSTQGGGGREGWIEAGAYFAPRLPSLPRLSSPLPSSSLPPSSERGLGKPVSPIKEPAWYLTLSLSSPLLSSSLQRREKVESGHSVLC